MTSLTTSMINPMTIMTTIEITINPTNNQSSQIFQEYQKFAGLDNQTAAD